MADKPVTREEKYLAYLTGDYTGEIPKPITRKEKYLYELCLKGIGGEISPEEIKNAVNEYLEKNPVKPGATTEQAQQIEQNKEDLNNILSPNLFNPKDAKENTAINQDDGTEMSFDGWLATGYIPVSKNDVLYFSSNEEPIPYSTGAFYDKNKQRVDSLGNPNNNNNITVTSDGYARFSFGTAPMNLQIEKGSRTTYVPYGELKVKVEVDNVKEDISTKITKFYASSQGETHLADSDNGKIMDMMLYGKSEQKQYSGKNLINSDEYYSEYKQSDGTYKGVVNNFNDILVPISKYIGTQITASCKVIVPPNTSFVLIEATINGTTTKGSRIESSKSGVTSVTIVPKTENDTIRITYGTGGSGIVVVSEFQIEKGSEATSYEPYTGGQSSPSPNYPQEIKSVVNPTVKVTNEDGLKVQSVTLNNITLNAIPVSSGGNVTIDGQQYIADYVDVEHGKVIRNILKWRLGDLKYGFNNAVWHMNISELGIDGSKIGLSNMFKIQNGNYNGVTISELYIAYDGKAAALNMRGMTDEEFKKWLREKNPEVYNVLTVAEEIPITPEEVQAFKALVIYYPVTNVSVNSEQLDGYTVFNYPISMTNGWNYVKKQLNDNRDYIYDMDLQSAEAYVNSEYAVALTELEV